jgi:hypothetical protein
MDVANPATLIPNRSLGVDTARAIAAVPSASAVPFASAVRSASVGSVALFTSTLFVSAFLLFLVEPMVAKMVLPMLGGAPMVWNSCMLFFQVALLAGYAYAHGAARWLPGRMQIALHAVLLALPFFVLPVAIQGESISPPEGNPIVWLLLLLAGAIGLPFFVLSATASVLQHWFSRTGHPAASDPYFLYAASNVGSFVALIAYPTIVEPLLSLPDQSRLWASGYTVFVALVGACAIVGWRATGIWARGRDSAEIHAGRPLSTELSMRLRARWVALAFIPSSFMLAVTTYLSTDIASVPLLWMIPLGLYLLTFAGAFSSRAHAWRHSARVAFPLLLVPLALMMCTGAGMPQALMIVLHLLAFATAAFLCHSQLADSRPSPSHLTEFYLWISFGGMLGGIFNGLAAPYLFKSVAEYPLVLVLACLMLPAVGEARARILDLAVPLAVAALTTVFGLWLSGWVSARFLLAALSVPAFIAFSQRHRPLRFALSVGALLLAGIVCRDGGRALYAERTFFGVYRVQQDRSGQYIVLAHGTTLHGLQATKGPERSEPLSYYHRQGPFGQALAGLPRSPNAADAVNADRVAVIGLGVGTLAAYAQPAQHWTFYEIDPAVERIARDTSYFTYLQNCGDRCRVIIGDARLSLARAPEDRYGLLVLDAFNSDAIPVHLLTSEALALYLAHLRPGGAILFHISNSHLALAPVVARLAQRHRLVAFAEVDRRKPDWPESRAESLWVAMARRREDLGAMSTDARWTPLLASAGFPLWTDNFSNILSVLQLR